MMNDKKIIDENYFYNHCYCCDKEINDKSIVEFTYEFDAFVCIECYERIMSGNTENEEEDFIREEWLL